MLARKTMLWFVLIVLLLGCAGGGYVLWLSSNGNERLRIGLLEHVAKLAPRWDVKIGRANFDWHRRIHLRDVAIAPKGEEAILHLPDVVVTLDPEKFADRRVIDIRRIDVQDPQAEIVHHADGSWNWQRLLPLNEKRDKKPLPEWHIEGGIVHIRFERADGKTGLVSLNRAEAKLIPAGRREFRVQGTTQIEQAGGLSIDGQWNIDSKTWSFDGRMNGLAVGHELLQLVSDASPQLDARLVRLKQQLHEFAQATRPRPAGRAGSHPPFSLASDHGTSGGRTDSRGSVPIATMPDDALDVSGLLDMTFRATRWKPDAAPEIRIAADVRNGRVANRALPFPLHAIEGRIDWDERGLRVQSLSAKNGPLKLTLDGEMQRQGETLPARFELHFTDLALDERLRSRLPHSWRKIYDSVQPGGFADGEVVIRRASDGGWVTEDMRLTLRDCTATHFKFPYPLSHVDGTVRQVGEFIEMEFTGRAGKRPVKVAGYIRGRGPECEAAFEIEARGLPLDEQFRDACPRPVAEALNRLKLEGVLDLRCRLVRAANSGRKFETRILARVTGGAVEYADFPWRITDLAGNISFDSSEGVWRYTDLRGRHGAARLAADASFHKRNADDPGRLQLTMRVVEVPVDEELRTALPPRLMKMWNQLDPQGKLALNATIGWVPGQPARIDLPDLTLSEGHLKPSAFPYPLENVAAHCTWKDGRLEIASFSAEREGMRTRFDGHLQTEPNGDWRLRLERFFADDLVPDRAFRRALPPGLRVGIEQLDPRKPISLTGMMEFRGTADPRQPMTAAWKLESVLSGNRLTAGFDLDSVHGRITSRGTWDGTAVHMRGDIDLDSAVIRGYQFTQVRGPCRMDGKLLFLGSPKAFAENPGAIPSEERLTARIIDGTVALDCRLRLPESEPGGRKHLEHHTKIVLAGGRLEEYARRYLADGRNLKGTMNGWLDLRGSGTGTKSLAGKGQLQISPAALYELPVIAQIFSVLSFVPPDRTAFKYALVDFGIGGGRFDFNVIDLVGDAISLRGRGTARFDGRLALDFYSMMPRNQIPIPLLNAVVGEVTRGWVGVEVRGSMNAPVATVKAVPELDNALQRFLQAFESPAGSLPTNRLRRGRATRSRPPRRPLPLNRN